MFSVLKVIVALFAATVAIVGVAFMLDNGVGVMLGFMAAFVWMLASPVLAGMLIGRGIAGAAARGVAKKLKKMREKGFINPERQYFEANTGIAIDRTGRKLFLANGNTAKVFDFADVLSYRHESDYVGKLLWNYLYVTVNDLDLPRYRIGFLSAADAERWAGTLDILFANR